MGMGETMQELPPHSPNQSSNAAAAPPPAAPVELPARVRAMLEANDARWAKFAQLPFEQWPERERLELDLSNWDFRPRSEDLSATQVAAAIDLAANRPWFGNLHRLLLYATPIEADSLASLARFRDCTDLRDLLLAENPLRDEALAIFSGCTRLQKLALRKMRLSRRGLRHFAACHELRSLDFFGTPIFDKGLALFSGRALEKLDLTDARITDKGLATLVHSGDLRIAALKELYLSGTRVSDQTMRLLDGCLDLERLDLVGCWRVSSDGLDWLGQFKKLRSLNLGGTDIDDRTLRCVKDCPSFWEVDFSSTEITPHGLLEFLEAQQAYYLVECTVYLCSNLPDFQSCEPGYLIDQLRELLGSGGITS
jgi:hypothetical protein